MLLDFLDASLPAAGPYDRLVRAEIAPLLQQTDAALGREMEAARRPIYVRQFLTDARRHALQPLGDFALGIRLTDYLGPEVEALLGQITTDPIEQEQYRDVVHNRARARDAVVPSIVRGARVVGGGRSQTVVSVQPTDAPKEAR